MLPLREPIGKGRPLRGVDDAVSAHAIATITSTAALVASDSALRLGLDATHHISASAGSGTSAWASFTSNAAPTRAALKRTQRAWRVCTATIADHSAAIVNALMTESMVSLREVSTAIGSTASASEARLPATRPQARVTA